jgi:23S rRNA pseudouridine2605 synthase
MPQDPSERLQKVLAHAGVASRRKSEELIRQGRVTVNGQVVTRLGTKVDPVHDEIRVDGRRIRAGEQQIYLMLHKPRGTLAVMDDPRGRPSLGDLVSVPERVYPVGRLDALSEGLILLTNDGELANILTHPRYQHEKEYRVLVNGRPSEETLEAWRRGVLLDGKQTAPAQVGVVGAGKGGTTLRVLMREGRKRQIRSVASLLGHPVRRLRRVALGPLRLGDLAPGQWRPLTPAEIRALVNLKRQHARKAKRRSRGGPRRGGRGR